MQQRFACPFSLQSALYFVTVATELKKLGGATHSGFFSLSLCTSSLCVLQPSPARLGSSWRCLLRSVPSVQREATPLAVASASTNGIPCLLDSVAWQPCWRTVPTEMRGSPATGLWVGRRKTWKLDGEWKINETSVASQFFLGASRKLSGVQPRWVHGLSHLRRPSEETGLCQLWVPVSRQQPAVWVLCELEAAFMLLLLFAYWSVCLSGCWAYVCCQENTGNGHCSWSFFLAT